MSKLTLKEHIQCFWANKPVVLSTVAAASASIAETLHHAGITEFHDGKLLTAGAVGGLFLYLTRCGNATRAGYELMRDHIAEREGTAHPLYAAKLLHSGYCYRKGTQLAIEKAGGQEKVLPHGQDPIYAIFIGIPRQ